MRMRDQFIKLFRATGKACYLRWARIGRNIVNRLIDRANANYIISQLSGQRPLDRTTNVLVDRGDEPHFLNKIFFK